MNAARRAIIKDMQFNGMTGKEAYEASKDPKFMKDWVYVSIRNQRVDGMPKLSIKRWDWRGRLRLMKKMNEIQLKKAQKLQSKVKRRANYIRKHLEKGFALSEVLKKADERFK